MMNPRFVIRKTPAAKKGQVSNTEGITQRPKGSTPAPKTETICGMMQTSIPNAGFLMLPMPGPVSII
jgi:hypothetical protein